MVTTFSQRSSYEDGDFGIRLRGGSLNFFQCHSLESGPLDPKSSGNESIGIDLTEK